MPINNSKNNDNNNNNNNKTVICRLPLQVAESNRFWTSKNL